MCSVKLIDDWCFLSTFLPFSNSISAKELLGSHERERDVSLSWAALRSPLWDHYIHQSTTMAMSCWQLTDDSWSKFVSGPARGSVDKGTRHQAWWVEFSALDRTAEEKNQLQSAVDWPPHAGHGVCACACVHKYTHAIEKKWENFNCFQFLCFTHICVCVYS